MFKYNEIIKLIKTNGQVFENIKVIITPDTVFIEDEKIPVEANDTIEHILPSGIVQIFEILDPGYCGKHKGFPAYKCKIRKKSNNSKNNKISPVTYNLHGTNSRVNVNSVDNSVNNIILDENNVFDELMNTIEKQLDGNIELLNLVKDLQNEKGKPNFLKKYQDFISKTSSHMAIISPFIPILTQMI